jgi:hypothetical protein
VPLGNITLAVDQASGPTTAFGSGGNYTVTITGSGSATATTIGGIPQFTVGGAGSTFKADFANITIFNAGSVGASQITFDGTNAIQADPPAPAAAASMPVMAVPTLLPAQTGALNTQAPRPDMAIQASLTNFMSGDSGIQPAASGNGSAGLQTVNLPVSTLGTVIPASYSGATTGGLFSSISSINSLGVQTYGQIYELNGTAQGGSALQNSENGLRSGQPAASTDSTRLLQGGISARGRGHKKMAFGAVAVKELSKGAMLLAPETTTDVNTPFGSVRVEGKSLALVVSTDRGLSVYDLDDLHRGSIVVHVNDDSISLLPGQHVTITDDTIPGFEHVNPASYIGYRNLKCQKLGGSFKAYQAEFNHLSAISGLEPLKDLFRSQDQGKKKAANHLLKTATLLNTLSSGSQPFVLMTPPATTAMNK